MIEVTRYRCSCGKEYKNKEEALECERLHVFEVIEKSEDVDLYNLPTKIRIKNKTNGLTNMYVSEKCVRWVPVVEAFKYINVGEYYLLKTEDDICVAEVRDRIFAPGIGFFVPNPNRDDMISIYETTYCCRIILPDEDKENGE